MRRRIASGLLALLIAAPAGAQEPVAPAPAPSDPESTLAQRTLWVGVGGGAATLVGAGLWASAFAWGSAARDANDVSAERASQHLGLIGGGLTLAGLCAIGAAAVMSSWKAPVSVSFAVTPHGGFTLLLGARTF